MMVKLHTMGLPWTILQLNNYTSYYLVKKIILKCILRTILESQTRDQILQYTYQLIGKGKRHLKSVTYITQLIYIIPMKTDIFKTHNN